jgi:hypothetical protein
MLEYWTTSIDEEKLLSIIDELTQKANACVKKKNPFSKETPQPFRVIFLPEQLDEEASDEAIRFYLVVTPDFSVSNEDQAWNLCQSMKAAAEAVEKANEANYVLLTPPRKQGPARR